MMRGVTSKKVKTIQTAQKTSFSLWLYWICLFLVRHFLFVHGLETCREDTECLTPGIYCLHGFCDGNCIPCQQFLRQPHYSGGCAKNEEDCGPCLPSAVTEELVGMRHAFRCKKVDELILVSSSTQHFTILEWVITCTLIGVTASALMVIVLGTLYMKRKKKEASRHDQLSGTSPSTVATEVAEERNPLYNPDCREEGDVIQPLTSDMRSNEERPLERVNNVQAQPMNDPFDRDLGEGLNPSDARLLLDVPSNSEGSANDDVLAGANEGVTVELSNYRNETRNQGDNSSALHEEASNQTEQLSILPSNTLPTSDGVPLSIEIEPDCSHNGSEEDTGERCYEHIKFGFLLKVKRVITRTAGRANNHFGTILV